MSDFKAGSGMVGRAGNMGSMFVYIFGTGFQLIIWTLFLILKGAYSLFKKSRVKAKKRKMQK